MKNHFKSLKMVKNASYYFVKRPNVAFYNQNGEILHLESIKKDENITKQNNRFDKMLDPTAGKLRPHSLVINNHTKIDRCLYAFDKKGQMITYQEYIGPSTLKELCNYQKLNPFAIQLDYDWILKNPKQVHLRDVYKIKNKKCKIL